MFSAEGLSHLFFRPETSPDADTPLKATRGLGLEPDRLSDMSQWSTNLSSLASLARVEPGSTLEGDLTTQFSFPAGNKPIEVPLYGAQALGQFSNLSFLLFARVGPPQVADPVCSRGCGLLIQSLVAAPYFPLPFHLQQFSGLDSARRQPARTR